MNASEQSDDEAPDELARVARALREGPRKWPRGIFAAWYPVKDRWIERQLRDGLDGVAAPLLACTFLRDAPDGLRLAGSGMVIANPPWQIEVALDDLCRALATAFAAPKATHAVEWWVRERAAEA